MNVGLYSFARTDLNKEILYYQKEVFRKFNLNLTQIVADCDEYGHGETAPRTTLGRLRARLHPIAPCAAPYEGQFVDSTPQSQPSA